jgi:hypothetical protein
LAASLTSTGTFTGAGLDFGAVAPCRASGKYNLAWVRGIPRLRFTDVTLRTSDDVYTGHGATQNDGKLLILLTDSGKELRLSGPPGKLKAEEPAHP